MPWVLEHRLIRRVPVSGGACSDSGELVLKAMSKLNVKITSFRCSDLAIAHVPSTCKRGL